MRNTKFFELGRTISEIVVVNDKDLAPYIEVLNFSPENITQKPLGTLLGFFEIKDNDEDSAYIVNFLSSVAKKEYFSNPKRTPIDSFEAALHKVNLALSEIAKHNNVSWIGKLEIALCVITESQIHFSVTGNAKIFLIRNGQMTEISEGLASDEAINNPIKTFIDISSGQLDEEDKVIVTTDDIFHVLSENEIMEGAQNFSNKKFARFIQTALINELPIAGTVVVDFFRKETRPIIKKVPRARRATNQAMEIPNAFSSSAFYKSQHDIKPRQSQQEVKYDNEKTQEYREEYVDRKTGHIYLKDNNEIFEEEGGFEKLNSTLKERCLDLSCWIKDNIFKKVSFKGIITILELLSKKLLISTEKIIDSIKNKKKSIKAQQEMDEFEREIMENREQNLKNSASTKNDFPIHPKKSLMKRMIPSFSRIKMLFLSMNKKQKTYLFVLLALIIVTPLIFNSLSKKEEQDVTPVIENEVVIEEKNPLKNKLQEDKNIVLETNSQRIHLNSSPSIINTKIVDNELFIIDENKILVFENDELKKEFLFPEEFSKATMATYMESLKTFFILTEEKQLLGFSAKLKRFQENTIEIPEDSNIETIGTYLTYLYLVDKNQNQIYRYPRVSGGFGEKTNWIKDEINLEKVTDMTISDRIILTMQNGEPISLFRGSRDDISFEKSKTSISWNKIFTTEEMENTYVLDVENSRIIIFDKDRKIEKQIYNEYIADSISFDLDANGTLYIATPSEIFKITE